MKSIKFIVRLFSIGMSLLLFAVCANSQSGKSCPPPGTMVPFAKVVNEAFTPDYVGCDITVKAEFLSSTAMAFNWDLVKGTSGRVPFQVVVPGQHLDSGPMGALPQPHVFLSKDKADVIFSLNKGDLILIRGAFAPAPVIKMMGRTMKISNGTPPAFIASDLILANASDAAVKDMMQSKSSAAVAIPEPVTPKDIAGIPEITLGMIDGVFIRNLAGNWITLKLLQPYGSEDRGFPSKRYATYRGAESLVHLSVRRPVIFVQSAGSLDASGWHILQLGKKHDHRDLALTKETAFGVKDVIGDNNTIEVARKKITDTISSLTPAFDLPDGEYAVTNGLFYFDFGIGR